MGFEGTLPEHDIQWMSAQWFCPRVPLGTEEGRCRMAANLRFKYVLRISDCKKIPQKSIPNVPHLVCKALLKAGDIVIQKETNYVWNVGLMQLYTISSPEIQKF